MAHTASPTGSPARWWPLALVTAVVGINVRAALGAVPPLLPEITADYPLTNAQAGMLTSAAALAIGLCAPLGQRLGARWGADRVTGGALLLLGVAGLAHLAPTGVGGLFAIILTMGAAMGAASAMIPSLVVARAGQRRGITISIYSAGMASGVALTAALAVPLETLLGGWRPALASTGALALAAAVAWHWSMIRPLPSDQRNLRQVADARLPWRSPTARLVTAYLALQMTIGYTCMAWVAPFYLDLGVSPVRSASLLVLFQGSQLLSMMILPTLAERSGDRRPVLAAAAAFMVVGLILMLLAPLPTALVAVTLTGLGVGGGATLGLVLVGDATTTVADGSRLTALCLLVGNVLGAGGPLALGLVADATGSLRPGLLGLLGLAVTTFWLISRWHPERSLLSDGPRQQHQAFRP